jgi:hypothetical protein
MKLSALVRCNNTIAVCSLAGQVIPDTITMQASEFCTIQFTPMKRLKFPLPQMMTAGFLG